MASEVTKDGLEYLVEIGKKLVPIEEKNYDGRRYTRSQINAVDEPLVQAIRISTLSSLSDLCTNKFSQAKSDTVDTAIKGFEGFHPKDHVVHVVSPTQVQVVTAVSNVWKKRAVLIDCNLQETTQFTLGQFMKQDEFIIAVLSCFVQSDERDYVAKLAGNALSEQVTTAQDDGVSQTVGQRMGATLAEKTTVKNIVKLRLYRTFREVDQPESPFLFRLKQSGDNIPLFAFFEADGGAWKLQATENIARFLRSRLTDAIVVS